MARDNRLISLALVILIGIIVQVGLFRLDNSDTPAKTAVKFTKAYYKLDKSMSKYLCKELAKEDGAIVDEFINREADKAVELGYNATYMRSALYSIHTEIEEVDDSKVTVRLSAHRKRYINPIYTIIGNLFLIGETYDVDETINLKKEDGKWKVCGKVFELSS